MEITKYKIRYQDTMTTYLLDETFNTQEEAKDFIDLNLGEGSLYEVKKIKTNESNNWKDKSARPDGITNEIKKWTEGRKSGM